jgi:hypothetical protein
MNQQRVSKGMRVLPVFAVLTCIGPCGGSPLLHVPVRLSNRSGLPPADIGRIELEAARILARAGIRLDFLDCPPACAEPLGPAEIAIQLLAGDSPLNRRELGFARPGLFAAVYCGRAEDLAAEQIASRDEIIAHAIVHETAHMLLTKHEHSMSGIMRPVWNRADLERIASRSQNFVPQQTRALREAAARAAAH